MSPFEWFKLGSEGWQDYPIILAVIADGIDSNPEWVKYIKNFPKWRVECHGWDHRDYRKTSIEEGVELLKRAKDKIEHAFDQEVKEFYPPWMRHSEVTKKQSELAGLKEVIEDNIPNRWLLDTNTPHFYFHYWSKLHIDQMENICHLLQEKP